jgi:FkbM family methyltransferase
MNTLRRFITTFVIRSGPTHPLSWIAVSTLCWRYRGKYRVRNGTVEIRKGRQIIRIASNQFIHAPEISRLFETYFSQVVPESNGNEQVIDYSHPRLHRYTESGLEFELSSFPEEQSAINDYFRWYRPAPGDCVFDIGAYCGVSTYHFSKCVGLTGRVFAFEPDPVNFGFLLRNIERHHLVNVIALNLAIAGSSGTLKFNSEATIGAGLARAMSRISLGEVIDVEALSFEEACARYGLPRFVKIDVEGGEVEIISSAAEFIRNHQMHFVLDTSHKVDGRRNHHAIENLFTKCGYEFFSSDGSGLMTTWARPLKV